MFRRFFRIKTLVLKILNKNNSINKSMDSILLGPPSSRSSVTEFFYKFNKNNSFNS